MKPELNDALRFVNPVHAEIFDKDGNFKSAHDCVNGIVDGGIAYMLDRAFNSASDEANWYIGLLAASPTLAAADTMASNSWTEFSAYSSPAARPAWGNGAAATRAVTNAATLDFTISGGSSTVAGIFMATVATISSTSGTLWATAEFSSPATVTGGDVLKVTYTVSG